MHVAYDVTCVSLYHSQLLNKMASSRTERTTRIPIRCENNLIAGRAGVLGVNRDTGGSKRGPLD